MMSYIMNYLLTYPIIHNKDDVLHHKIFINLTRNP